MARKRMLAPEFFTSGPVNDLPIPAMVTFAGLWVYFDDYGRGEDDAALVKAVVWPRRRAQTEARVASDLAAIAAAGLVCRYEVGGVRLIHSPTWFEHQKISHATPSRLPPCPFHEAGLYAHFLQEHGDGLDRFRRDSGAVPELFPSDSGDDPERLRSHAGARARNLI